jgi:hypothetical protein
MRKPGVVPGGRVELPLSRENRILSPARLPVPPSGQFVAHANEGILLTWANLVVNVPAPLFRMQKPVLQ